LTSLAQSKWHYYITLAGGDGESTGLVGIYGAHLFDFVILCLFWWCLLGSRCHWERFWGGSIEGFLVAVGDGGLLPLPWNFD
jgi:hypothetical protein